VTRFLLGALAAVACAASCKKGGADAPADAAAVATADASSTPAADAGAVTPLPGPPAAAPRAAAVVDTARFADLGELRRHRTLAAAAALVQEATRDVYGARGFAAEVEKVTAEPLRPPLMLVADRFDVGPGPELWRITYEAWCGRTTGGASGYKSDHLLLSREGGFRVVVSYRPGCEESGEPEVTLVDLDGDGRDEVVSSYASTRLGSENRVELKLLRRTAQGFVAQTLLSEQSPFQTLEVRYVPSSSRVGRDIRFRTFREDPSGCAFFEVEVAYAFQRPSGMFVRGAEQLRPVSAKALTDEGEDIDPRCAR
jgi:hypothetical protein